MKRIQLNILLLIVFVMPNSAAAQVHDICAATICTPPQVPLDATNAKLVITSRGDTWVSQAVEHEKNGRFDAAAEAYLRAVPGFEEAESYLRLRSAKAWIAAGLDANAEATLFGVDDGALPGLGLTRAAIEFARSKPRIETVRQALMTGDREHICETYLRPNAQGPELLDLLHAHCSGPDEGDRASSAGHTPTVAARTERAARLYRDVRFRAAKAEIDKIDRSTLSEKDGCAHDFLKARITYRLRKRNDAAVIYQKVATTCENETLRVKSYYAWGERRFDTGRLAEARKAFRALIETFPHRSHADDALLFLGRIARETGDTESETWVVTTALDRYRDGDMLFEIIWEHLEPLYRAGQYQAFLDKLNAFTLPDHDDQYFSQGRLEYFAGMAHAKLSHPAEALRLWQLAWTKYPFSFYGYLASVRIQAAGSSVASLSGEKGADLPAWLVGAHTSRRSRAITRFLGLGLVSHAADVARGQDETSLSGEALRQSYWLAAFANHLDGRHDFSHNIVRRRIDGRPWVGLDDSTRVQWQLAWPNPYGNEVSNAVAAEARQAGAETVHAALPSSIMREESSFIEDVESYAGALGLMQLMPRTALAHDNDIDGDATPDKLKTAPVNIRVGVDHLYWLSRRFDGHPALIVAAYNAGSGAVGKWLKRQPNDEIALFIEDVPYLQTRNYTKRVIGSYAAYQWMSGIRDLDARVANPAR